MVFQVGKLFFYRVWLVSFNLFTCIVCFCLALFCHGIPPSVDGELLSYTLFRAVKFAFPKVRICHKIWISLARIFFELKWFGAQSEPAPPVKTY